MVRVHDGATAAIDVQRLRDLGWIEGRTIAIEYRWAEGRSARAEEITAEFIRLKVDANQLRGRSIKKTTRRGGWFLPLPVS